MISSEGKAILDVVALAIKAVTYAGNLDARKFAEELDGVTQFHLAHREGENVHFSEAVAAFRESLGLPADIDV